MIDEKIFATEFTVPDEFESMVNISFHHDKLKDIMKFVIQTLKRHEKGIKLNLDRIKNVAPELGGLNKLIESLDTKWQQQEDKLEQVVETFKGFEEELLKKVDSSESLKFALEKVTEHDSVLSLQQKEIDQVKAKIEDMNKKLARVTAFVDMKSVEKKKKVENFNHLQLPERKEPPRVRFEEIKESSESSENQQKHEKIAIPEDPKEVNSRFEVIGHKFDEKVEKLEEKLKKAEERFQRSEDRRNKTDELRSKKLFKPHTYEAIFPYPNKIYTETERHPSPTASHTSELKTPAKYQPLLQSNIKHIEHRLDLVERVLAESEPAVLYNKLQNIEKTFKFYESVLDTLEPEIMKNRLNIKKNYERILKLEKELMHKTPVEQFDAIKSLVITLASGSSRKSFLSVNSAPTQDLNYLDSFNERLLELENFYVTSKISSINFEEISYQLERIEQKLDFKVDSSEIDLIKQVIQNVSDKNKASEHDSRPMSHSQKPSEASQISAINRKILQLEAQLKVFLTPGHTFQSLSEEIKSIWDSLKSFLASFESYTNTYNAKFNELALTGFGPNIEKIKKSVGGDIRAELKDWLENCERKFADKFEMLRGFKYVEGALDRLEAKVRKSDAEEVILARKPLGGWTCGSCDKVVEKLSGKVAGYTPWNKLPWRDPKDRIVKAGSGYSNMILQLEPLKRKMEDGNLTERSLTPTPLI